MKGLIALMIVGGLALGGCAGGAGETSITETIGSTPSPDASSAAEASDAPTDTAAPPTLAFKPITLKGSGKKIAKFKVPEDQPAIATSTYNGSSNFAVTSIAADGSQNDLLVNVIGKYRGTVLFDASAGQHSVAFEVDAEGPWQIVVKPVTSARGWGGASQLKGIGDDVVRVSPASSGLVTLDLTHRGEANFAVESYTNDGGSDLLANEIGHFAGQVLLPNGTVLLAISADGAWTATPG